MAPKLAELLELENPFLRPRQGFSHSHPEDCLCWVCHQLRAYDRALEDMGKRIDMKFYAPRDVVNIVVSVPGYLAWIPITAPEEHAVGSARSVGVACV